MGSELDMPADWNEYIFSDAIEVNPKRQLKKGEKAPFIEMKALNPNSRIVEKIDKRLFKGGGSRFKNGDTLFARITPCLEHGKITYINKLEQEQVGHGSTEFIVFSGIEWVTDDLFVYYLSRWDEIRNFAIKNMTGTSGRQIVPNDIFKQKRIKIPDITEQHRIATILGSLDDKIELNHEMNKTLEEMAEAIFKRWFVDFEFPDENGKPYKSSGGEMVYSEELQKEIPKGWGVKPIDEIADFLNGLALQKYPPKNENYLPVIKIRELRQGVTESSDRASPNIDKRYIVDNGDVLFSWSGSLEVCIWCGGKGALNQHLFKVTSQTYPKWFYYQWIKFYLPKFRHIAKGKATTMGHIRRHHLSETYVIVPFHEVMEKMNETINPLIETTINNSIESRQLANLRDTLLPKLLSGEIRVNIDYDNIKTQQSGGRE